MWTELSPFPCEVAESVTLGMQVQGTWLLFHARTSLSAREIDRCLRVGVFIFDREISFYFG